GAFLLVHPGLLFYWVILHNPLPFSVHTHSHTFIDLGFVCLSDQNLSPLTQYSISQGFLLAQCALKTACRLRERAFLTHFPTIVPFNSTGTSIRLARATTAKKKKNSKEYYDYSLEYDELL